MSDDHSEWEEVRRLRDEVSRMYIPDSGNRAVPLHPKPTRIDCDDCGLQNISENEADLSQRRFAATLCDGCYSVRRMKKVQHRQANP